MLKWILAISVGFSTIGASASQHTGELIFKVRNTKDAWGIEKLRPTSKAPIEQIRQSMLQTGRYEFVELNTRESLPKDTFKNSDLSNQWHHDKIHTAAAWALTDQRAEVTVAVCDSGAQVDHEDLSGQILPGVNMVDDINDNSTSTSHGTMVAGLIAALPNEMGVVGISPFVKVLPLRISDAEGGTSMDLILACIRKAADLGVKVINVSFTGVNHPGVQAAGAYAAKKGALLVFAAGNQGRWRSLKLYPDWSDVLVVGATNAEDQRWRWFVDANNKGGSNFGRFIDLMAPGHNIYSTTIYDLAIPEAPRYRTSSGTSFSAPVVSAVAALIFSVNPRFTPRQVQNIILKSADSLGSSQYYGRGRVNALKAVQLAHKTANFVEAF